MFSKSLIIFTLVTGVITTVAAVVGTIDQVINGDRRAAIAGAEAGKAIANKLTGTAEDQVIIEAEETKA